MKRSMRFKQTRTFKLLCIVCFAGSCILVARFCHHQTRGFALSKIEANFPLEKRQFPPCEVSAGFLRDVCSQKFRFLGRGFQSFVFVSEDDQYVLKLFSNRYQKKISCFSLLSLSPLGGNWALAKATLFKNKLDNSFTSYQLAFDELANKTALLYLHLNPTVDLPQQLTIVDPLNISHQIDPNQFAFLIQRKVDLAYPALQRWVTLGKQDSAKQALSSLIQLFILKWQHAIADSDPLIRTNYGFIGTEAIQIDVGPLSKRDLPEEKAVFAKEMGRITASLKTWLTQNAPELVPYLEQELADQLDNLR